MSLPMNLPLRMAMRSLSNARLINLISCGSEMDGVIDVLVRHGYLVVFGWVLADQIGLPLPAVPFLLAAGALAGNGRLSLALILAAAALASLASDTVWYWTGRVGGGRVLRRLGRTFLGPASCVRRTQEAFGRYGARSLLFAQ